MMGIGDQVAEDYHRIRAVVQAERLAEALVRNARPLITVEMGSYEVLAALAPRARSYLCVGVQEGECLGHVISANPAIRRLALCDTWGSHFGGTGRGSHDHIAARLAKAGWAGTVNYLDGDSRRLIPLLNETFDLSYVDGDHTEEAALEDMLNVWPRTLLAMVVHDIRTVPVWSALIRFLDGVPAATVSCAMGGFGTAVVWR